MKRLMPVVMTSVMVLPMAAHAEGPIDGKVYGKINAAYLSTDDAGTSDSFLESHASRLGFKGKSDVENGMSIVYQLEYEINPTEKKADATSTFKSRNSYVGLGTDIGTFVMGIHDTPFKLAQGKVDQFNDMKWGDIKELVQGEVRATDVFGYISPEMNGLSVMAAVTQYEDGDEGSSDATSVSVAYKGVENLYLSLAVDSETAGHDATRLVAQYKMGALTVGALFNESEAVKSGVSKDSSVISASYKIDNWKLKAQFGSGDEKNQGGEQVSFGADYKLGKKSKVYVYNSSLEDDSGTDKSVTGLGIEHKF
ncbi:porin [Pseudomonadota bacterium]